MGVPVPWPLTNNPGLRPTEGTGRLVNTFAEASGGGQPVWRRAPGATVFARTPSAGSANISISANAVGGTFFSSFFELVGATTTPGPESSAGSTVEVVYPSGTQSGDLVFIIAGTDPTFTGSIVNPTGFTTLVGPTSQYAAQTVYLGYKASTGETTASLVNNTTNATSIICFTIRGALSSNPIVDTGTVSTGPSGDPHPTSITNTTANSLLITCAWVDDDSDPSGAAIVTTAVVAGATTFNCGHPISAGTTAAANAGASVMVAFRPMATTGMFNFTTGNTPAWSISNTDDEWATYSFTVRHS